MRLTLTGIALSRLVGTRFQGLFTPLAGVLFTFPSRYLFTIGHRLVFSLGRWSSRIPTGFHVSRGTWVHGRGRQTLFAYRTITFCGHHFQGCLAKRLFCNFPSSLPQTPTMSRDP